LIKEVDFLAPFPTADSRLALLCWSRDIPLNEEDTSYQEMKKIQEGLYQFKDLPILLLWGRQGLVLPPSVLHLWQEIYPNAWVYQIDHASHFLQEDASDEIVGKVQTYFSTNY